MSSTPNKVAEMKDSGMLDASSVYIENWFYGLLVHSQYENSLQLSCFSLGNILKLFCSDESSSFILQLLFCCLCWYLAMDSSSIIKVRFYILEMIYSTSEVNNREIDIYQPPSLVAENNDLQLSWGIHYKEERREPPQEQAVNPLWELLCPAFES
jgi:hypothetical protein